MKEYRCHSCKIVLFKGEGLEEAQGGGSSNFNFYRYFYFACPKCPVGNYFGLNANEIKIKFK